MRQSARSIFGLLSTHLLLLSFFFILTLISMIFVPQAQAQDIQQNYYNNVASDLPRDPGTSMQLKMIGLTSALYCIFTGIDPLHIEKGCLDVNPHTGKIGYTPQDQSKSSRIGGILNLTTNMIAMLYIQPISLKQDVQYYAEHFGIQKAQAQSLNRGEGFIGLTSVQQLFINSRNITYILLGLIFAIIGLAIMLRVKIDPRTVMSIQNQIPKLIVGIVLITFSYSIAGLLIDTMWAFTYFGINAMTANTKLCDTPNKPLQQVASQQILNNPIAFVTDILGDETGCFGSWDGISGLSSDVAQTFGDILTRITLSVFGLAGDLGGCDHGITSLFGLLDVGDCVKVGIFGFLKYIIFLIGTLIIFIALISSLIRIWFTILKAYISFTIAVILGPFWIVLGLLPGGGLGFMQWIRHLVSHLALFPASVFMLVLAAIFAANGHANTPEAGVFLPPLIGNPNIADGVGTILAFSTIMIAPNLLNIIREGLKTKQGTYTGAPLIGAAAGTQRVMGGTKKGMEAYNHRDEALMKSGSNNTASYERRGIRILGFRLPSS